MCAWQWVTPRWAEGSELRLQQPRGQAQSCLCSPFAGAHRGAAEAGCWWQEVSLLSPSSHSPRSLALAPTTSRASTQHHCPCVSGGWQGTSTLGQRRHGESSRVLRQAWQRSGVNGAGTAAREGPAFLGQTGSLVSLWASISSSLDGIKWHLVPGAVTRQRQDTQRSLPLGVHRPPHLKHVGGSAPSSAPSCPFVHASVHADFFLYHVVLSNADFLD